MSFDFKIQNTCDHRINWESAPIGADLRTITPRHFIASNSSVRVRINTVELDRSEFQVINKKNPLSDRVEGKAIYLNKKEKAFQPIVEILYITLADFCPKCLGGKVLDDFIYDSGGDIRIAERELQLIQTFEKYIITKLNTNKFHTWMGTEIHSLLGSKINDLEALRLEIVDQITSATNKLKRIQNTLVSTGRSVSDGELFGDLVGIDLKPVSDSDPSILKVIVTFTAQSGNSLQFEQLLEFAQLRERVAF